MAWGRSVASRIHPNRVRCGWFGRMGTDNQESDGFYSLAEIHPGIRRVSRADVCRRRGGGRGVLHHGGRRATVSHTATPTAGRCARQPLCHVWPVVCSCLALPPAARIFKVLIAL